MARNRTRSADRNGRLAAALRMPGPRWVPVPLAVLMAVMGWLVFGSVLGQHAVASAHAGPEAGGLGLTVNQVVWIADDMGNPGQASTSTQFEMPESMMPGMQTGGDKRLRVEIYLRNISNRPSGTGLAEFRLFGTAGRRAGAGRRSTMPRPAARRCRQYSIRASRPPSTSTREVHRSPAGADAPAQRIPAAGRRLGLPAIATTLFRDKIEQLRS